MLNDVLINACISEFRENSKRLRIFMNSVADFFSDNPLLIVDDVSVVHSIRSRIKDEKHLFEKITRKTEEGRTITPENLFRSVTDLAGVRVLHLHHAQFPIIHKSILKAIHDGDWCFAEPPKAFTWDPESETFFKQLGLTTELRSTFYTSIHYLVRPNVDSPLCCEIQVRTLFEEVWGEIDHLLNYPEKTDSISCREQLRVLAKLVGTGSRLVDSILKSHAEYSSLMLHDDRKTSR